MVDGGFMCAEQDPAVTKDIDETRDTEYKNNGGGSSPPSNQNFKFNNKTNTRLSRVKGVF